MKSIELKTVKFIENGNEEDFSYKDMVYMILQSPVDPAKGSGIEEIRKSIRVLDAIDNEENGTLEIEDADFSYLLYRVRNAKFTSNNRAFIDFVDHFEGFDK